MTRTGDKLGYRPGLDGLRAVAVSAVIGYHYYHWPEAGTEGVELFFVLSGFLITTLLLEEWRERHTVSLSRFYLRRGLRLLPALWAFLLGWTVLASLAGRFHLRSLILGLTYTTNIATAVRGGLSSPGVNHLWSLGNEEQFYLLWPLLLLVALRRRWPAARLAVLALSLAMIVLVARDGLGAGQLMWFRFDAMLFGCVAGILFTSRHRPALRAFCCWPPVAATASTVLVYLLFRRPVWDFDSVRPRNLVFALAAAITIVWVVEGCPGFRPLQWGLTAPPVVYVGRISYALYLWHPFVLQWLAWGNGGHVQSESLLPPLAIVGSLLAASVSYWLVERPFLRIKWRLSVTGSHDADAHWATTGRTVEAPAEARG
jgi:peptidoglycan/LPS O-acetylase OafA/YrhL